MRLARCAAAALLALCLPSSSPANNPCGMTALPGRGDPGSPCVLWTPARPGHRSWSRLALRVRPAGPRKAVFFCTTFRRTG
jgi:hypothetical protein